MDGASDHGEETPAGEQFMAAASDRCPSCGVPLASDQRYCINCGERRGKPRFTFAADEAEPAAAKSSKPPRQGSRMNGAATLVGFIAVLLLAMGVGVLIGHDNSSAKTTSTREASVPPVVVTVGGGGSTSASTKNKSSGKHSHKGSKKSSSAKHSHVSKADATAAAQAANKAYGGGNSQISDPTVQPGQKASGPGTQNGKFTGNFFP
jgi:hypothetical protein